MELNFSQYEVRSLNSIAHLFPPSKGRTGIYVLRFADGQQYVGQAVNVVGRFAQHRRHWDDIVAIDFARVPRRALDEAEVDVIRRREGGGASLRNIHHATHVLGDRDIDLHVTPDDQYAWLNGDDVPDDVDDRVDDPEQRSAGIDAFQRLKAEPEFANVTAMCADYVAVAIPRPRETERTFWALSAAPATNRRRDQRRFAAVTVNSMEVFVLALVQQDQSQWILDGFAVLSPSTFAAYTDVDELGPVTAPELVFDWDRQYHAAGQDQVRVRFQGTEGFQAMRHLPGFAEASREIVLRLMRKGPTVHWRAHNFPFADEVFRLLDEPEGLAHGGRTTRPEPHRSPHTE